MASVICACGNDLGRYAGGVYTSQHRKRGTRIPVVSDFEIDCEECHRTVRVPVAPLRQLSTLPVAYARLLSEDEAVALRTR